jgi:hypothetical protein
MEQQCDVAGLLEWAAGRLDDPGASLVQIRLAGAASRMAFEFHLAGLCRVVGPPRGIKWHNYAVRLLKCGEFDMAHYRAARRISRLAIKAVHGMPFDRERALRLLAMVTEFVGE